MYVSRLKITLENSLKNNYISDIYKTAIQMAFRSGGVTTLPQASG